MSPEWTNTNYRERHLRIGGRIVGKITCGPDQRVWAAWEYIKGKPRAFALRNSEEHARKLVEKRLGVSPAPTGEGTTSGADNRRLIVNAFAGFSLFEGV